MLDLHGGHFRGVVVALSMHLSSWYSYLHNSVSSSSSGLIAATLISRTFHILTLLMADLHTCFDTYISVQNNMFTIFEYGPGMASSLV